MNNTTAHIDAARLAKFNQMVSKNSTLSPYILFPVRLETHFREATVSSRPQYELELESILTSFNNVLSSIESIVLKGSRADIAASSTLMNQLYELKSKIENLDLISSEDKKTLMIIAKDLNELVSCQSDGTFPKPIVLYSDQIYNLTLQVETASALKRDLATVFLNDLERQMTALETLGLFAKTPYRSNYFYKIKGNQGQVNKKLYQYVTGKIVNLFNFFIKAPERFTQLPSLDQRQRDKALGKLNAGNLQIWKNSFNSIQRNMEKFYQNLPIQEAKLMEQYNKEWKELAVKAQGACTTFMKQFNENIASKPYHSYTVIDVTEAALLLRISIVHSSVENKYLSGLSLTKKNQKLNTLLDHIFIQYNSEKIFIQDILNLLVDSVNVYSLRMKAMDYTDYLNDSKNNNYASEINVQALTKKKTKPEGSFPQKQLCVRIFPDEIFIHQHDDLLTKEEWQDGQVFWIQWFIASANLQYEKTAWNILWQKHGVMRASWIARKLRPINLASYQNRRPFINNVVLENALNALQDKSNELILSEARSKTVNENNLKRVIQELLPLFYEARKIVMQYDLIVDYLHSNINNALNYVGRKLDAVFAFYNQNPKYKNREYMAFRDIDYQSLTAFYQELRDLIEHIEHRQISLADLVTDYFGQLDNGQFFPSFSLFRDPEKHEMPKSAILPDRFMFTGKLTFKLKGKSKINRIRVSGRKVNPNLQLGFDPFEGQEINEDPDNPVFNPYLLNTDFGEIEVKGGMKWMTDYEAAVLAGMAITVPLPDDYSKAESPKFNSIYVLGVKNEVPQGIWEDFFNGHIYGQSGLDFLGIGTPTNSLDGIMSGYNSDDALLENRRFQIDVQEGFESKTSPLKKAMNLAMGMDDPLFYKTLGRVSDFENREIEKSQLANAALSQIFFPSFNTDNKNGTIEKKVDSFLKKVPDFISKYGMSRGIIPTLRVGNQPYGILPTTAFSRFKIEPKTDTYNPVEYVVQDKKRSFQESASLITFARDLQELLKQITYVWSRIKKENVICSENLGTSEPQKRFTEMLGLTPVSVSFFERTMMEVLPLLQAQINYEPLSSFGFNLGKILKKVFSLSETSDIIGQQIKEKFGLFHAHPIADMVKEMAPEIPSGSNIPPFVSAILKGDNLDNVLKKVSEEELPLLLTEFMDLFSYRLDAWWLGLVNYQLDRIRMGYFGNQNSKENEKPRGSKNKAEKSNPDLSIGAFGWVFNLSETQGKKDPLPQNTQKAIEQSMNLKNKGEPIYQDNDHREFMIAPSINHAITATVLRSAYVNSKKEGDDSRMCVNLSSIRVRQALRIMDGIRNGLSVGAILGAELERNLHEAYKTKGEELDRYIFPLREMFPLKVDIKSEQTGDDASSYLMSVINGDLLLNSFLDDYQSYREKPIANYLTNSATAPDWFKTLLQGRPNEHKNILARLIEQMADAFDALGDVILSEAVYRLVQGNRVAFSAWINNLQDGNFTNVPEVTEFPMHSAVIRHKVVQLLPAVYNENEAVLSIPDSPMAEAEPSLNQWVSTQLGDLERVRFIAAIQTKSKEAEEAGEYIIDLNEYSLGELGVSPLEYLYFSAHEDLFKRYLEYRLRREHNLYEASIEIDFGARGGHWSEDFVSFAEQKLLMENLRSLLASARALNASDFSSTVRQEEPIDREGYNVTELKERFVHLWTHCRDYNRDFDNFIQNYDDLNTDDNRDYPNVLNFIIRSFQLGILSAGSALAKDCFKALEDNQSYKKQKADIKKGLLSIKKLLQEKINEAEKFWIKFEENKSMHPVNSLVEAFQMLLSKDFKVFPQFVLDPVLKEDKEMIVQQLKEGFSYDNVNGMALENWLGEVAKVREPMRSLQGIRMITDWNGVESDSIHPLQFPFQQAKDSEWLGLEVTNENYVEDKESLVLFGLTSSVDILGQSVSGIIVDQWMELIPYRHQEGAVVFNFDQPNAEAPQTILIAVPAEITMKAGKKGQAAKAKNWTLDDLALTLNDTIIMAENRAVEPDHLFAYKELAKILPLLKYGGVSKK